MMEENKMTAMRELSLDEMGKVSGGAYYVRTDSEKPRGASLLAQTQYSPGPPDQMTFVLKEPEKTRGIGNSLNIEEIAGIDNTVLPTCTPNR